jgi:phosphoribosylformimino-5-aminoimidazole carboxamide ribotide isomerase
VVNIDVLRKITQATDLKVDFGGGVKSTADIEQAFEAGASMITGGSIAVREPKVFEKWIDLYGPDKVILGADIKDRHIAVGGWMETSEEDIIGFINHYERLSIKYVICTDISRDGVLNGPAVELYKELLHAFPGINLIASGGVGSLKDVEELAGTGVWGVIIGKAIYEGRIHLDDLIKLQK